MEEGKEVRKNVGWKGDPYLHSLIGKIGGYATKAKRLEEENTILKLMNSKMSDSLEKCKEVIERSDRLIDRYTKLCDRQIVTIKKQNDLLEEKNKTIWQKIHRFIVGE